MTDDSTTANLNPRLELVRKLLAKAEHPGTSEVERETYRAKAYDIMMQHSIDRAMVDAADHATDDPIVRVDLYVQVPKTYSYEFAIIALRIATAFGGEGFVMQMRDGVHPNIVAYQSDTEQIRQLYTSLVIQATLSLATWYATNVPSWASGTDKFNAKRSFLKGYANGVGDKLQAARKQMTKEAGTGAELVLVDRHKRVLDWVAANTQLKTTTRRYNTHAAGSGFAAGQRADTGQRAAGTGRQAIGS